MIGEYVDTGREMNVTINPAVPGAQYRITAWALDGGTRRSATPTVLNATSGEARELCNFSAIIINYLGLHRIAGIETSLSNKTVALHHH